MARPRRPSAAPTRLTDNRVAARVGRASAGPSPIGIPRGLRTDDDDQVAGLTTEWGGSRCLGDVAALDVAHAQLIETCPGWPDLPIEHNTHAGAVGSGAAKYRRRQVRSGQVGGFAGHGAGQQRGGGEEESGTHGNLRSGDRTLEQGRYTG